MIMAVPSDVGLFGDWRVIPPLLLRASRGNLLAGASPRSLPRDDRATFEDLTAPDTPGLGPVQGAGQTGVPQRTVPTEALGELQLGRALGEPQIRVLHPARQGAPYRCGRHRR